MRLYLVRPARAERRAEWSGPGGARPLTEEGRAQAKALSDWLSRFQIDVLACGPSLNSRQTLEPLAEALGQSIMIDDRLDRDATATEMLARVQQLGQQNAIVCIPRGQIQTMLGAIIQPGAGDFEAPCERGGAWLIEGTPPRATYFAPHRASRKRGTPMTTLEARALPGPGSQTGNQRIAVLDLGSTSFHLMVGEWTPDGELRRVGRERIMLRMGSELARSESISAGLLDRSVEAVRELGAFAEERKADLLVTVATAALRRAKNGPEVLRELEAALGGPIHLLSGLEEARVVYRAIRARLDLGKRTHVGLDLGGGSLEVIVGKGSEILYEATLPLGVARMHGELEPHEIHTKEDLRRLRHRVREILSPHLDAIQAHAPVACVAVGGTARGIGRLILRETSRELEDLRGLRLERKDIAKVSRDLSELTIEERVAKPGVSSRRADLLPFGAEILTSVLSLLGLSTLTICDWGLREGILLDLHDARANARGPGHARPHPAPDSKG